jgi:hypothetical protein
MLVRFDLINPLNLNRLPMKFLFVIPLLLFGFPAFGQEGDPVAVTRVLTPLIIIFVFYLTRRRAVGGWLSYYYYNLFMGGLFAVATAMTSLENLNSEGRDTFHWWMSVVDYVPGQVALIAELIFGVRLLFRSQRNKRNLMLMRYSTLATFVSSIVSSVVTYKYFPDDGGGFLTSLHLIASLTWCWYWFISKRVEYVMTRGNLEWNYEEFKREMGL